jgi:hypothetical protein
MHGIAQIAEIETIEEKSKASRYKRQSKGFIGLNRYSQGK